jgi:hypothetical protein
LLEDLLQGMLLGFSHFILVAVCGSSATYGILIISVQEMHFAAGRVPKGLTRCRGLEI